MKENPAGGGGFGVQYVDGKQPEYRFPPRRSQPVPPKPIPPPPGSDARALDRGGPSVKGG